MLNAATTAGHDNTKTIAAAVLVFQLVPNIFTNHRPLEVALTFAIMFVCSSPSLAAGLHGKGPMPTDVVMPQMGESIFEGTITKWLKKAGEKVQRDEPLFEISTDKVDTEIPSPVAGTLAEILVEEGKTVGINTVVGRISDGAGG